MSCLTISIAPLQPAQLALGPVRETTVALGPVRETRVAVVPEEPAAVAVVPEEAASAVLVPVAPTELSVGEVCSISGGTLVVLAASDGPLRTRNGGYLLLNPATNPAPAEPGS